MEKKFFYSTFLIKLQDQNRLISNEEEREYAKLKEAFMAYVFDKDLYASCLLPEYLNKFSDNLKRAEAAEILLSAIKHPNLNISVLYIQDAILEIIQSNISLIGSYHSIKKFIVFLDQNKHPYAKYIKLFVLSLTKSEQQICKFIKVNGLMI